jgi:hypothetical protein
MSGFSSAALPGKIPTSGPGRNISIESIMNPIAAAKGAGQPWPYDMRVKSVNVRIFDLSDEGQRKKYEKLQSMLISKVSRGEVIVNDSRKDLVHRADGTSYWMKYVEYIELDKIQDSRAKEESK